MQNSLLIAIINNFQFFRHGFFFCSFIRAGNANDVYRFAVLTHVYFLPPDGICVALALLSQNHEGPVNMTPARPHRIGLWMASKTPIFWLFSPHWGWKAVKKLMAWNKGKENRGGQERRKCHLEGVMLRIARVKGMCPKFINIYDSWSHTRRENHLKAQSIYFVIEKQRKQPGECSNFNFFIRWRERTNKMQLIRCLLLNFYLSMFRASLCPSSGEQDRVLLHAVFCL